MGRRWGAALLVLVLVATLTSCQRGRVGGRCKTGAWGEDGGALVLKCVNGRWRVAMTKAAGLRALAAISARTTTTTAPPVTTPRKPIPGPANADDVRVLDMVERVFGPSVWAGDVRAAWWRAGETGYAGLAGCERGGETWIDGRLVVRGAINTDVLINQNLAHSGSDADLGDVVAHEGAHVIACMRWPEQSAPPGWPLASDGSGAAESFAECLAAHLRGPTYDFSYGCPSPDLPAAAARAAA